MAVNILTKAWGCMPPVSGIGRNGHPLAPRFGFVFEGTGTDLARKVFTPFTAGGGTWSSGSVKGYAGKTREHTGTGDLSVLGLDSLLLPTGECTIVIAHNKTDGTNRNAVAFGNETATAGQFCAAYIPFSDGVVYFDYGGETGGSTRVSASGLTFGDDVWCLTVGAREQAIYQNGVVRVSAAQNPTRANGAVNFQLGRHKAGGITSDLVKYKFMWIYHRQLTVREITDISNFPYLWVAPRS